MIQMNIVINVIFNKLNSLKEHNNSFIWLIN